MRIRDFLNVLGDTVEYEYQGDTAPRFRGLGLKAERRGVRRTLYVLPEVDWHPEYPRMLRKDERPVELEFETAISNGANGIVCPPKYRDLPVLQGTNCLFVEDTLNFTYRAVEAVRRSLTTQKIIGVTGSAGKSTTKLMIGEALKALEPEKRVQLVQGNRNIAASVLWQASWAHGYDFNVLEMAGSVFTKFPARQFTASPHVAVITSISEAHLEYLGDLRGVAEYKAGIFKNAPPEGVGVINADTPFSDVLVARAREGGYDPVTYGDSEWADIQLQEYDPASGRVMATWGEQRYEYTIGATGRHMALNSLAVIGVLRGLGFTDLGAGLDALAAFDALGGRGRTSPVTLESGAEIRLTDESFNANPASMRASVEAFVGHHEPGGGRRVIVLGDMRELGPASPDIHRSLADMAGLREVDEVHLFGEDMGALHDALAPGLPTVSHWTDLDPLTNYLLSSLQSGDRVLVKGAHATGLNGFVKGILSGT